MVPPRLSVQQIPTYSPGTSKAGAVKLSSNENPYGPHPAALAALQLVAPAVSRYPDQFSSKLRSALAGHLDIQEERIIIGNGSDELMAIAAGTFLNTKEESLAAEHTFSQYHSVTSLYDGSPVKVPMRHGAHDPDAFRRFLGDRTRIVWLCNPNNPTGTAMAPDAIEDLLEYIPRQILVVLDEAYVDYVPEGRRPPTRELVDQYENLLVLRTFSKAYGLAGLRVGYGFGCAELIEALYRVKPPFNVSSVAEAAAAAALEDPSYVRDCVARNAEERARLSKGLSQLGFTPYPSAANFVCIEAGMEAHLFAAQLMDAGYAVRPLESFGLPEAVRITVGKPEDTEGLLTAIAALHEAPARSTTKR